MDHHVAYSLGVAHAQLGRPGDALHWLRNAANTGFPCSPWYARDPLLEPLRGQADFERFMSELRTRMEMARDRYARTVTAH